MNIEIKITSIKGSPSEVVEAELVEFLTVTGNPNIEEVKELILQNSVSVCNVEYNENSKTGMFTDLNFEFSNNQLVSA
jgi:hypothetical protein